MPPSDGTRAWIVADGTEQALVLTDEPDRDAARVSGRWLKSVDTVEVRK